MDLGGGNLDETTNHVISSEALLGVNMDHGGQIWTPTNGAHHGAMRDARTPELKVKAQGCKASRFNLHFRLVFDIGSDATGTVGPRSDGSVDNKFPQTGVGWRCLATLTVHLLMKFETEIQLSHESCK